MSLLDYTPGFDATDAAKIARVRFGLAVDQVDLLPSERDQNFLVGDSAGQRFVLKIAQSSEDREFLEAQNEMLDAVSSLVQFVHQVVPGVDGDSIQEVVSGNQVFFARLVTYLPGRPLATLGYHSPELLADLGSKLAMLDKALINFDYPALHRQFDWDLARASAVIEKRLDLVQSAELRKQIEHCLAQFDQRAQPLLPNLPCSVIQNDANDYNVLVAQVLPGEHCDRVTGIIDFGDSVYSWTVGSLAVAVSYAMLDKQQPMAGAAAVVEGYCRVRSLNDDELHCLFGLVCLRLCTSIVMAEEQSKARPDDPYLTISQRPIRELLPRLVEIPYSLATAVFRVAAGQTAVANSRQTLDWINRQNDFTFPLAPKPDDANIGLLDFSITNPSIGISSGNPQQDLQDGEDEVAKQLSDQSATVGVGGYLEPRLVYNAQQFRDSANLQQRTIHLGVDLFAPAGVEVIAPLGGTVKYVRTCADPLDYGTYLILEHETDGENPFFSLYGHLAEKTKSLLREGQTVKAGDQIGWLGAPEENGGWVPHLHFQLMLDLLDYENFPGVALADDQEVWSQICPDPNLLLRLKQLEKQNQRPDIHTLMETRQQKFSDNLALSYNTPLHLVRGIGQYLFDAQGRRYLDAYNNVPHVGHCHPVVAEAIARQARLLNTNTRYLSELSNQLAERVADTMPEGLEVCFFVNSASEANELALRLARAKTGARDLIVTEGAYHGHSTSLIDISPYKHSATGGSGPAGWVHAVELPDTYRGKYRDPETAGRLYAEEVGDVIERLAQQGRALCGFIAESCPSVAGQLMLPVGYLANVYKLVRDAGGVCIADDVQTGYGRLGKWFYGFKQQEVVPDIVVLGKPIGNGHPLAAVVTTREIVDCFANGMEFFSTFGGNTVSCAVGLSVLQVLERESLQQRACEVGEFLIRELGQLQQEFGLIGDVRGSGFFLGVELVRDHQSLEPAAREASYVVERLKNLGILIGTDGIYNNVIKIRPPMCFDHANGQRLLESLRQVLEEIASGD